MSSFTSLFHPLRTAIRWRHRFSRVQYPWMNKWRPVLSPPQLDKDLTEQNSEFVENQRLLEYRMDTPLNDELWPRLPWTGKSKRSGLIALKLGVYPLWTVKKGLISCTVLQVLDNHALRYIPPSEMHHLAENYRNRSGAPHPDWMPRWFTEKRYGMQYVGAMSADPRHFTKDQCELFEEAGVPPKRRVHGFLVTPEGALKPGTPLTIHHFRLGDRVDITSRTINRGFQGGMERWLMEGGPKGHGSTKFHRKMGSAGGGGGPIVRGKRMPGVMGNRWRTMPSLQIVRINYRYNLIFIRGTTAGPVHSFCYINDCSYAPSRRILKANPPPMPTAYPEDLSDEQLRELPEDVYHFSVLPFDSPSLWYPEDKAEKGAKKKK